MASNRITSELLRLHVAEESLSQCVFLDLGGLGIGSIERLESVPNVKTLLLHRNALTVVDNLEACSELWSLNLAENKIVSVEGLTRFSVFGHIDLSSNMLESEQLSYLKDIQILSVCLKDNPLSRQFDERTYRYYIINLLPSVWILDHIYITSEERDAALKYFEYAPPRVATPVQSKPDSFVHNFKRNVSKIYSSSAQEFLKNFSREQSTSKVIHARRLKYMLKHHQAELYDRRLYTKKLNARDETRSKTRDSERSSQLDLVSLLTCTEDQKEKLLLLLYAIKRQTIPQKDVSVGLQRLLSCPDTTADELIFLPEEPMNCIILLLYLSLKIPDDLASRKVLLDFLAKIEKISHTPEVESIGSPEMEGSLPQLMQLELKDEIPPKAEIVIPSMPVDSRQALPDSPQQLPISPTKMDLSSTTDYSKSLDVTAAMKSLLVSENQSTQKTSSPITTALVPFVEPSAASKPQSKDLKEKPGSKKSLSSKAGPSSARVPLTERKRSTHKAPSSAPKSLGHRSQPVAKFAKRAATTKNPISVKVAAEPSEMKYKLDVDPNYRSAEFYSVRVPLPGDKVVLAPGIQGRIIRIVDTVTVRLAPLKGMKQAFDIDTRAMFWNPRGYWQHANEVTKAQAAARRQVAGMDAQSKTKRQPGSNAKVATLFSYDHTMEANFVLAPSNVVEDENSRLQQNKVPCWDPIQTIRFKKLDDKALVVRTKQLAPVKSTVDHILADRYREEYMERSKLLDVPLLEYRQSERQHGKSMQDTGALVVYDGGASSKDARASGPKKPVRQTAWAQESKSSTSTKTSTKASARKGANAISSQNKEQNKEQNKQDVEESTADKKPGLPTMPEVMIEDISEEEGPFKRKTGAEDGFFTTAFGSDDSDSEVDIKSSVDPGTMSNTNSTDAPNQGMNASGSYVEIAAHGQEQQQTPMPTQQQQVIPQFYYIDKPKKKRGGAHQWYLVPKKTQLLVSSSTIRPLMVPQTVPAFDRDGAACYVSVREVPKTRSTAAVPVKESAPTTRMDKGTRDSRPATRNTTLLLCDSDTMRTDSSQPRALPPTKRSVPIGASTRLTGNRNHINPNPTHQPANHHSANQMPDTQPQRTSKSTSAATRRSVSAITLALPAPQNPSHHPQPRVNNFMSSFPSFNPTDPAPTPFDQTLSTTL